ncbi:peptide/nickel transport system ATP-binding protein [Tamaricihabitans halophyticus]|uniref:Peptide/nickel transport system ATP-binding protein n=1 Tax=Tamaricihabitans halophyticus TaxID=1262583 RepID=A0A4R2QMU0_9PSEU|nr:ABC transporter ATP-binding protein [Tamaricihabitans halophyticus]TCP50890.1 peptide/nickel transport system ATP-binding protein [Tamaricihabitans halophyticus]
MTEQTQPAGTEATPTQVPANDVPAGDVPAIEVRDLRRTYTRSRTNSVPALRGVSFAVPTGGRFGIVGESGSGKSTLVRLLAALDKPSSGSIWFRGRQIDGRAERELAFLRRELQVVFQDPMGSLDPRMRVRDIVAEPLDRRTSRADRADRVAELLAAVGLAAEAADRYPHQFSGGQRQRISIARALAPAPRVLIADEPVSALDVSIRAQILDLLLDLVARFDLTLLLVSHDLGVIRYVCDTVAVMRRGEIVEHGAVHTVYQAPEHPYTEELITAAPSLRAVLDQLRKGS